MAVHALLQLHTAASHACLPSPTQLASRATAHLRAWSRYCRRSGPMSMLSVSNTDRLHGLAETPGYTYVGNAGCSGAMHHRRRMLSIVNRVLFPRRSSTSHSNRKSARIPATGTPAHQKKRRSQVIWRSGRSYLEEVKKSQTPSRPSSRSCSWEKEKEWQAALGTSCGWMR